MCSQAIIDSSLAELGRTDPQARVAAIVQTTDPAALHRADLEAAGLTVRRVFRLLPGLAVDGAVATLLTLAGHPWVKSVSLDREVHAMR